MRLCWAWRGCKGFRALALAGTIVAAALVLEGTGIAQTYNVPPETVPPTLTSGQTLYLWPGGTLPGAFNALAGSTIYVTGGTFTDNGGSRGNVYLRSGSLGVLFDAEPGSRITASGGNLGFGYEAFASSTTLVAGGSVGPGLNVLAGAEFTIVGTSFTIDGIPLPGLSDPWDELVVSQFDGSRLSGSYLNGGTFGFDLNAAAAPLFNARFHPGSTLRLVLALPGDFDRSGVVDIDDYQLWKDEFGKVPVAPGAGGDGNFDGVIDALDFTLWRNNVPTPLAGDYNRDGQVDPLDYALWKTSYGNTVAAGAGADGNLDGRIDAADYLVWRNHFDTGQSAQGLAPATAVPEPTSVVLAALVVALLGGHGTCRKPATLWAKRLFAEG